ncbi:hypothetical protein [Bradyrhizobium sp. 151]|uniref:hypothetical protein n=1 Tax=Bradyrhizobium sp. 151 TaxID=2782626 RepID=UPI001FF75884|nr:hypothetical protein [Bradyrhizobium sp. 151]MCK1661271.1 hypothetical protein [Bradyrhizobium sp. 151]
MAAEIINGALADGSVAFSLGEIGDVALLRALRNFGRVTQTELRVRSSLGAAPNTYSSAYGRGAFPFHTDFAFRARPPRMVALMNPTQLQFERPTLVSDILDLPVETLSALQKSSWKLRTAGRSYFVWGFLPIGQNNAYRWDLQSLEPANEHARQCVKIVPEQLSGIQSTHEWLPNSGLLLDNWRVTHSRASAPDVRTEKRTLIRYEVW